MKLSEVRKKFPMYADVPDEQLLIGLHRKFYSDMPFNEFNQKIQYDNAPDPTQGMSGLHKFNAGVGKAFSDLGTGAAQLVGMGPNASEIQETRKLDAPLLKSGAGAAGNVAGNIAAFAPLAVVPGANTVAGAGALGAVTGAFQPTGSPEERLLNMGVGGGLGAGTQYAATTGAQKIGEMAARKEADNAMRQSQNKVRDDSLKAGQEAGYVVPPSAVTEPSFLGGRLESLGGKAALGQEGSIRNQEVTDRLARAAGGLGREQPISSATLREARKGPMSDPYREVSALSPQAAADLDIVKTAKKEANLNWGEFNRQGTVDAYKRAIAADQQAEAALNRIEQQAVAAGQPNLVSDLKQSRVAIAKNQDVRRAVNEGTGSVDASVIGKAYDRNPDRYSGELKTIGAYQQAFPHYMREGSKVPTPGVGKTELLAAGLLGTGGYSASDSPYGSLLGLAPFASGPARGLLFSKVVQDAVANPSYKTGLLTKSAASLEDAATREKLAMLARAGLLPMIPSAVRP
jgi:hypothetical protein